MPLLLRRDKSRLYILVKKKRHTMCTSPIFLLNPKSTLCILLYAHYALCSLHYAYLNSISIFVSPPNSGMYFAEIVGSNVLSSITILSLTTDIFLEELEKNPTACSAAINAL